ncbi:MAG: c-type cytochrome [Rhodanobacter sp.]
MYRTIFIGMTGLLGFAAMAAATTPLPTQSQPGHSAIQRGLYLVKAGDCAACHTADGGKPFAGGRAVPTPFGVIYSTNITPDKDTGIGKWTEAGLYRAMHSGIDRQGNHLYPAFPYPWYTKVTPGDVRAIHAYLGTLTAVRQVDRKNKLPWPLTMRSGLAVWNKMYLKQGTFAGNANKSAPWNRGAYLVNGLGHCGACHTKKNFAGAVKTDQAFQGGMGENAFAPSLAGDMRDGLGGWTVADIVEYLKTGSNDKSSAAGPMAEVVHDSTQYLTDADLTAIGTYLKDVPRIGSKANGNEAGNNQMTQGAAVYADDCTGCHMDGGQGMAHVFPPLKGSAAIQAKKPDTIINVVLGGAAIPVTTTKPTGLKMPNFHDKLDNAQVAAVVTYIRNAWGNRASSVSAGDVADMRKQMRQKGD